MAEGLTWGASWDEEDWSSADCTFGSREEAIKYAESSDDFDPGEKYWTGRAVKPALEELLPSMGHDTVEHLIEQANDIGGEFAEPFMEDIGRKEIEDLDERLKPVILQWLKDNKVEVTFWTVEDVQEHTKAGSRQR
jgi:hypothetical protein